MAQAKVVSVHRTQGQQLRQIQSWLSVHRTQGQQLRKMQVPAPCLEEGDATFEPSLELQTPKELNKGPRVKAIKVETPLYTQLVQIPPYASLCCSQAMVFLTQELHTEHGSHG